MFKPMPRLPPADVWASYTPEQREAFWAKCEAVRRDDRRLMLIWAGLLVATIAAWIAGALLMIKLMIAG